MPVRAAAGLGGIPGSRRKSAIAILRTELFRTLDRCAATEGPGNCYENAGSDKAGDQVAEPPSEHDAKKAKHKVCDDSTDNAE